MRLVKLLLALAADGMAGFLDLAMGALIAFMVHWLMYSIAPPWWYLLVGSVFGFLPDLDIVRAFVHKGVTANTGDHRLTVMHRPLIMLPIVSIVVGVIVAPYWGAVACLGLLWHYNHDSRWMSVSDIDWLWPLGPHRELPYMDHPAWREMYWLQPTLTSFLEVWVGTCVVGLLVLHYAGFVAAAGASLFFMTGACLVWTINRELGKQEAVA